MIKDNRPANNRWREALFYLIAIALCLWTAERLFKLRRADFSVPFVYEGDAVFYQMIIKSILTNGWHLQNNTLGMPQGMDLHDFPIPDNFHLLLIKLMGYVIHDSARVMNLFFLLTFPLTTLTAFYVLRHFGVSVMPTLLVSILYAFTQYHLRRSEHHLMYTAYYTVPLTIMVLLWLWRNELPLTKEVNGRTRLHWRNPKLWAAILICVLTASTGGAYYSFFGSVLMLSVALWHVIRQRSWRAALPSLFLFVVMTASFFANLVPNILHRMEHGYVPAAERSPVEAEIHGLKIAQMLMPIQEHRLATLARFRKKYDQAPLDNENADSTLGFLGGFGFVFLLGWFLYSRAGLKAGETTRAAEFFDSLSFLNITALLLATVGGFGSIFAFLVSPQIRGYNRISVFITFFSLFTVALLLDQLGRRYFQFGWRRVLFGALVVLLTVLAVLDQTPRRPLPNYAEVKAEYQHDAEFYQRIEAVAPPQGMIFQLPLDFFPEGNSYDYLKAYFHTRNLRWSYGAMRARPAFLWQERIAALPTAQMVESLAVAGFCGITNDRASYKDGGAALEAELSQISGSAPLTSGNGRYSFFDLTEYQRKLKANLSEKEWEARQIQVLNPILLYWRGEFSGLEGNKEDNWRWCGSDGELQLENSFVRPRRVQIEMALSSANPGKLRFSSPFFNTELSLDNQAQPFSQSFELPPGKHSIFFHCDAPRERATSDPRELVLRVNNFKLTELN